MTYSLIITYNPDIKRLSENIESIAGQVDKLYIYDNASTNIIEIKKLINQSINTNIEIIISSKNLGISGALNYVFKKIYVIDENAWILTLDQDTVCDKEIIKLYSSCIQIDSVGIITSKIKSNSFDYEKEVNDSNSLYTIVESCITSGSFVNIQAWNDVFGFDDNLFIDAVDTDFAKLINLIGYKIIKINKVLINHEIGINTRRISIFGKNVVIFNHSPIRAYYIARNTIYMSRKYKNITSTWRIYISAYNRILVRLMYEKQKLKKLYYGIKGIIAGHFMSKNFKHVQIINCKKNEKFDKI